MVRLHRLGGDTVEFDLNPDLVLCVEATPDTVITLTTGAKLVVSESPDAVTAAVREWRVGILERALRRRPADAAAVALAPADRRPTD